MKEIEQVSVKDLLMLSEDRQRNIFIRPDLGFIGSTTVLSASEYRKLEIFRATDYQIGIVNNGSLELECDLQSLTLTPGDILLLSPGTLISSKKKSQDYDATIISIKPEAAGSISLFGYSVLPSTFLEISALYISLIIRLLNESNENKSVRLTVQALLTYLTENSRSIVDTSSKNDRKSEIFNSFVTLVNNRGRRHHQSGYYADSLCISLNYLNNIVKEKSGRTVYQWINEYLITEAKVRLLHTSDTVQQLSVYLNFPNSAFFCRFFKQHSGVTPIQFRKHG